jgi:hypothetical protein
MLNPAGSGKTALFLMPDEVDAEQGLALMQYQLGCGAEMNQQQTDGDTVDVSF